MRTRLIFIFLSLLVLPCSPVHQEAPGGNSATSVTLPTFDSLNEKVFKPKCLSCHNSPSSADGVDVSSYEKIMNNNLFPPLIVPGKPNESSLYLSCENKSMPQGGPPLSDEQLSAFREWIIQGAKPAGSDNNSGQCPADNPNCNQQAQCETDEPCETQCEADEPCP